MRNLFRILTLASLLFAAFVIAGAATPERASAQQELSPDVLLNQDGTLNLESGQRGTLDLRGWNAQLDPQRGPILTRETNKARLASGQWTATSNNGLNGEVYAIAVMGGDVYVGGRFTETEDGAVEFLNGVARYNSAGWSALPNRGLGSDAVVYAMAVMGSDLYVGGLFRQTGDGAVKQLNNIAKYSTTTGQWSGLPNRGLNERVRAMAVFGSDLWVGGSFASTVGGEGVISAHIIKFSGGKWVAAANGGLNGSVYALAVDAERNRLVAGGIFSATDDGTVTQLGNLADFFPGLNEWSPVIFKGLNGPVYAITVRGRLHYYIGGKFSAQGDGSRTNLGNIAEINGGALLPLEDGGVQGSVNSLLFDSGVLYVGGDFARTGDGTIRDLNRIAKYTTGFWSGFPNQGLNKPVNVIAQREHNLYVGGQLTATADGAVTNLNNVALFDAGANVKLNMSVRKGTTANDFTVSLTVVNRGPGQATGISLLNVVPDGYKPVTVTTPRGTCEIKKQKASCSLPDLADNERITVELKVTAEDQPVRVTNCAEVTVTSYDPKPENHKACQPIPPS